MIDARELRIGNLVKTIHGVVKTVSTIEKNGINPYWIFGERNYESINPIPLTPEWLEKAGFKTDRNFSFKEPISLILKNKKITFKLTPYHFIDIHSVHQLQNLFFALTGKELEFKNL